MVFKTLSNGSTTLKLCNKGLLVNESKDLIPFEQVFLYTYNSKGKSYYNLIIQRDQFDFMAFIFHKMNLFISVLLSERKVCKNIKEAPFEEVTSASTYLKFGDDESVSWGPVKDTGFYSIFYGLTYRKDHFQISVKRDNIAAGTRWELDKEQIDESLIEPSKSTIVPFSIWINNEAYWRLYYKQQHITEDSRWDYQKYFLILLALVVLWFTYFLLFT